jgi:SAM-dependent methyltransferase
MRERSAAETNLAIYDSFWEHVPDFTRYNPGARHRRRLILDAISGHRFSSALDVGCGSGELIGILRRAHPEIVALAGADLSAEQVSRNRQRFPDVSFYGLNIERSSLDRTFDLVICSEVIEHLDDQAAAMRHLAAMLNEGGKLVVTCPTGTIYATERRFGHVHHPSPVELVERAAAAELRPVSVLNWGWPTYRLLKWATNVDADFALRRFGTGAYSPAAKAISTGLYWVTFLNRPRDVRGCQIVAVFERHARSGPAHSRAISDSAPPAP